MSKVSPRWRWELACKAAKLPDAQAQYVLKNADQATLEAYRFKRASDRNFYTEGPVHDAYTIYSERPLMRRPLECFLLSGEKDDQAISGHTGEAPETIRAFHDIFFDVRWRLDQLAWVAEQFFAGDVHRIASRHDNDFLYHKIAWFANDPAIYLIMVSRQSRDPEAERASMVKIADLIRSMMTRQALLLGQCVGHGGELGLEVMKLVLESSVKALEQVQGGGTQLSGQLVLQVGRFIEAACLKVADPTGPSNLLQEGGREPRATLMIPQETAP